MQRVAIVLALVTLAGFSTALEAEEPPPARKLELDTKAGEFRFFVKKKGALKAFAHDHEFDVRGYTGAISYDKSEPAKSTVEIKIPTKDVWLLDDGKLSESDRAKVQATTLSDEILDAKKYPEIVFKSSAIVVHAHTNDGALPLSVTGTLTLHGTPKQRTLEVKLTEKDGALEVSGEHAFNQSDFGIEPYSTGFGMIGVQDEVSFKFRLVARAPAPQASPAPTPAPKPDEKAKDPK